MLNSLSIRPIHSQVPRRLVLWQQQQAQRRPYTIAAFMMVFVPIAGLGALSAASFAVKGIIVVLGVALATAAYRTIGSPLSVPANDDR
jgi:hypothetical protein